MRNWNINTTSFRKNSPEYHQWKFEQLINFGLQGEKLNRNQLKKIIHTLVLDPSKKMFLEFILSHVKAN